jgi:hypothetical protein
VTFVHLAPQYVEYKIQYIQEVFTIEAKQGPSESLLYKAEERISHILYIK